MYIFKNSWKNMGRNKGRNFFIVMIMTAIVTSVVISFFINATSVTLMEQVREVHTTQVTIELNVEKSSAANDAYMKENNYKKNDQGFVDSLIIPFPNYAQYKEFAKSQYVKESNVVYMAQYESDALSFLDQDALDYYNTHNPYPEMGERGKEYALGKITAYKNFNHSMNKYFAEGVRKVQEGKAPEQENECIISYELAKLNNLKVGDQIPIKYSSYQRDRVYPQLDLTISGIFFDGTEPDIRKNLFGENSEKEFDDPLLPAQNRRNEIITTEDTLLHYAYQLEQRSDTVDDELISRGIFYQFDFGLKDSTQIENFQQECYDKGLDPTYEVKVVNEYQYNEVSTPVIELGKVSDLFMLSIIGFGACLLVLISFLLIRLRTYEIGVLNAMGLRKRHITRMFIWESLLLTCISLCASFVIGLSLGKPITTNLIEKQMETSMKHIDQEDLKEVNINLTLENYCSIVGVALLLGMLTSMSGVFYTMRFEPIKILSNRE